MFWFDNLTFEQREQFIEAERHLFEIGGGYIFDE
jgi:hypothetical protein